MEMHETRCYSEETVMILLHFAKKAPSRMVPARVLGSFGRRGVQRWFRRRRLIRERADESSVIRLTDRTRTIDALETTVGWDVDIVTVGTE